MITCENRDQIALAPDLPGLTGVPASIAPLKCPDCGQREAILDLVQGDPGCFIPHLSCSVCGAIFELEATAYNAGLAAGVLIQMAREHEETCPHVTAAQIRAYLSATGWISTGWLWCKPELGPSVGVPYDESDQQVIVGAVQRIAAREGRPMLQVVADMRRFAPAEEKPARPWHEVLSEAKTTGKCPVHGDELVYDPDEEVQASGGDYEEHNICPADGCMVGAWYG